MEELEREEDAAGDVEPAPEPGSDGDESEPEFGPLSREEVGEVLQDLRDHGMLECLRRHVVSTPGKVCRTTDADCAPASLVRRDACTCPADTAAFYASRGRSKPVLCLACAQNGAHADVCRSLTQTPTAPQAGRVQHGRRCSRAAAQVPAHHCAVRCRDFCLVWDPRFPVKGRHLLDPCKRGPVRTRRSV